MKRWRWLFPAGLFFASSTAFGHFVLRDQWLEAAEKVAAIFVLLGAIGGFMALLEGRRMIIFIVALAFVLGFAAGGCFIAVRWENDNRARMQRLVDIHKASAIARGEGPSYDVFIAKPDYVPPTETK